MAIKTEAELEAQVTSDMPNNGKTKAAKVRDIFQNIIDTLFYWIGTLSTAISDLTTIVNGKASTSHTHAGSDITTGTVPVARLGTGTPSSANFLRGDGAWQNVPSNGLITENSAGTEIGTAAKMRFSNDFTTAWDAANSRLTLSTNKSSAFNILEDFVSFFIGVGAAASYSVPKSGLTVASIGGFNGNYGTGDQLYPSEITTYTDVLGFFFRQLPTLAVQTIFYIYAPICGIILSPRVLMYWAEKVRFINGALPTNTAIMSFQSGFADATSITQNSAVNANNGLYFYLLQTENGGKLQAVSASAGVYTKVDTGITITSGQYYNLRVEWNGTDARYYNGTTLLATITTNLPAVAIFPFSRLAKNATTSPSTYETRTDSVDFKYERI
jgi:hypothetical protein